MSGSGQALFLSYASQDALPAKRICDALRAAGVEVWFDQNELRGGDAWDAKIRRQIKECALFVPLISANTQARPEGYFRLEWKLAVDRSHLMSDDHPFLLPVVIDDTPEPTARVPDRFRDVQWMRLDVRDTPESLASRVAKLLAPSADAGGGAAKGSIPSARHKEPLEKRAWNWFGYAWAIIGVAIGLFFAARPLWRFAGHAEKPAPAVATLAPATPSGSGTTRAQHLLTQAKALYEPWDFASVDDLRLADKLLKEAADLEPTNVDVSAATAVLSYGFLVFGYDRSDGRESMLRSAADRAVKLAPTSDFAQLALALSYRRLPGAEDDALRVMTELAKRHPEDKFILRQWGAILQIKHRNDEALAAFDQAAALPGGDPIALSLRANTLAALQRYDEAEEAVNRAIAARPDYGGGQIMKLVIVFYGRGDIDRTKEALREIPARTMSDERVASVAAFMWYFARDPDKAAETLRYVTHDYVESKVVTMPRGLLSGIIHQMAGRREAAMAEWRAALALLEQRIAANPTSSGDIGDKAGLLALLGERAAAEAALRVHEQLRRTPVGKATGATWTIYAELGRESEVADFFAEQLAKKTSAPLAAMFRCHPVLDPFREHPRFKALAIEADRFFAPPAKAKRIAVETR